MARCGRQRTLLVGRRSCCDLPAVELYKLLLNDAAARELFTFAVNVAARALAPQVTLDAIALSRDTALRKPGYGRRVPPARPFGAAPSRKPPRIPCRLMRRCLQS